MAEQHYSKKLLRKALRPTEGERKVKYAQDENRKHPVFVSKRWRKVNNKFANKGGGVKALFQSYGYTP